MDQDACLEEGSESQPPPSKKARLCDERAENAQSTTEANIIGHLQSSTLTVTEGVQSLQFQRPSLTNLDRFLQQHPIQPIEDIVFNHQIAYNRTSINGEKVPRQWVSYSTNTKAIFCYICLSFCNAQDAPFSIKVSDKKHLYTRLTEHEHSHCHNAAVEAYMRHLSKVGTISHMLGSPSAERKRHMVEHRRAILHRVIEIIKTLGKQGLAFRGKRNESSFTLLDDAVNHGNFLAVAKLIGKFDEVMQNHIKAIAEKGRQNAEKRTLQQKQGKVGRGSFITFLSKSTVTSLVQVMRNLIQERIANDVRAAGIYSIEMDSTQDITSQDQCSIVIRYTSKGEVHERLLSIVKANGSSGEALFNLLKSSLDRLQLNISNCVGDSFDGAANMSGEYKGVQARISEVASNHIHVWCYAHTLNLVLGDVTSLNVSSISLFGLLNKAAVFFRESHKRMNAWENTLQSKIGTSRMKKLNTIGATRWWAKSNAIRKIFGSFDDDEAASKGLFSDVVVTLSVIRDSASFNQTTRDQANDLVGKFLQFDTVLTAFLYNRIFSITSPLSEYLQTRGIDLLQAWRMVESSTNCLQRISRDFYTIHDRAVKFCNGVNRILSLQASEDQEIEVSTSFPNKRVRRRKARADEERDEDVISSPLEQYRVEVFCAVMDEVVGSLRRRFLQQGDLYRDFAFLDPRRFAEFRNKEIPTNVLSKLCNISGLNIDREVVKEQLISFFDAFPRLAMTLPDEYERDFLGEHPEDEEASEDEIENDQNGCDMASSTEPTNSKQDSDTDSDEHVAEERDDRCYGNSCKSCFSCVFKVLYQFGLHSTAYSELYCLYKHLMTLAVTQVECERSFSLLKIIKSRLRSMLGQEQLEAFMLLSIERRILDGISNDEVIEEFAKTSKELSRLLTF